MADYSAFPVWDISGTGPFGWQYMVDPETLEISGHLRAELWAWAAAYDSGDSGGKRWFAEGRRLAQELQAELGPSHKIVFFNERGEEESVSD